MLSSNPMQDIVVGVLRNRISDESMNFEEAAQEIIRSLRLRQEWTWRMENGDNGLIVESRQEAETQSLEVDPTPVILHRLVTDWDTDE